jgi:hypothetical protein
MNVESLMDENTKKPYFKVTSDKTKTVYTVKKGNNGYSFYEIKSSYGDVADVLKGNWIGPDAALEAVEKYLNSMTRPSATVRRDENRKRAVASKVQSDD